MLSAVIRPSKSGFMAVSEALNGFRHGGGIPYGERQISGSDQEDHGPGVIRQRTTHHRHQRSVIPRTQGGGTVEVPKKPVAGADPEQHGDHREHDERPDQAVSQRAVAELEAPLGYLSELVEAPRPEHRAREVGVSAGGE